MPDFKKLPTVNGTGVALINHSHAVGGPATAPTVWLDASQITGLFDGGTVSSWSDVSGNGNNATQATSGNRPLYKTDVLNGRPVVRFDGTDDYLVTAAFGVALAQPNTVLVVARHAALATFQIVFDGTATNGRHALYRDNTGNNFRLYAGSAEIVGPTADTGWHIRGGVFNGAASSLLTDGAAVAGSPGTDPLHGVTLGADYAGAANFLNGDVAEVLVYHRVLTGEEFASVNNYLSSKYGVGASQAPDSFASSAKWGTD